MNRTVFMVALGLVAALATAMVYGFGGVMAVNGTLTVGTLLALAAAPRPPVRAAHRHLERPRRRHDALVSFERVFEVLDLQPLVTEKDDARTLPEGPLGIDVDHVSFRYPSADEVSLASLESTSSGDRGAGDAVLHDVSFSVAPGQPSPWSDRPGRQDDDHRAGVAPLRPGSGAVRVGDVDLRDVTMQSLHDSVGVVTQDAHLFHDTIRANPRRPARGDRGADADRAGGGAGARLVDTPPRASTPSSATAVTASPAERSSGSRSRGCSSRVLG